MSKASKLKEIYEGWKNVIFPTPEIKALAEKRIAVCVDCEHLNVLNVCGKCCCPHVGKAHSPNSRCPMNLWEDGWGDHVIKQEPVYGPIEDVKVMIWNPEEEEYVEMTQSEADGHKVFPKKGEKEFKFQL